MYYTSAQTASISYDWPSLRAQLLAQWGRLTAGELEKTGRNRRLIALLIERKYDIPYKMVENYLRNFERTMPLVA